jgi:hypothetical protein
VKNEDPVVQNEIKIVLKNVWILHGKMKRLKKFWLNCTIGGNKFGELTGYMGIILKRILINR